MTPAPPTPRGPDLPAELTPLAPEALQAETSHEDVALGAGGPGPLENLRGVAALRGAAMPWPDIVGGAAVWAQELGIGVTEDL
jgi:hypothetical protein